MRAPKKKPTPKPRQVLNEAQLDTSGLQPDLHINLAPAAEARLTGDGPDRPAPPAEAGLPGWQSLGKDHKPTHANGKQGRREKKVRW